MRLNHAFLTVALLTACASAEAIAAEDDLGLSVRKSSVGGTGVIWDLQVQNRGSDVRVESYKVNNGTCPVEGTSNNGKLPFLLSFGEKFALRTVNCEPIKVFFSSNLGVTSVYFDGAEDAEGAMVAIEQATPTLRRLKITSLSSIKISGVVVNRGNCGNIKEFEYRGPAVLNYGEVYRTGWIPCDPIEVVLKTDIGPIKINL